MHFSHEGCALGEIAWITVEAHVHCFPEQAAHSSLGCLPPCTHPFLREEQKKVILEGLDYQP
jgi:hypothetical protein